MTDDLSSKIRSTLLADQVFDVLETEILEGRLEAGRQLRVREVAEMVGTSIMPVRDALQRLKEAGLVSSLPNKGAVVRSFTVEELVHIYQVRTVLEVEATSRGTAHVTAQTLEEMSEACRRMQTAVAEGRVVDALELDEEIIGAVYRASGNPVLMSMIDTLWRQCCPYKVMGAKEALAQDDASLWEPQPQLIEAVRASDTAEAIRITAASLASAVSRLEARLEQPHEQT